MLKSQEGTKDNSSASIVLRIGNGDVKAEAELCNKYYRSLHFVLKRRCADEHLADDIAQDAFIVVLEKAREGKIHSPNSIVSFIRQTGVNLLIAHFRKESRRATDACGESSTDIPDVTAGVQQTVESKQSLSMVQQVIGELKVERDRDILLSYYAKEECKHSICERLDLTSAHFDRVLFRARSRLRQLIDFKTGSVSTVDR